MSTFWKNVKKLLPFRELEVKDLAFRCNIPYSTIINGMNKNSMPHADIALKVARALNVSPESLLGEDIVSLRAAGELLVAEESLEKHALDHYCRNRLLIDALEELPQAVQESLKELVLKIRDSYREDGREVYGSIPR